MKFLPMTEPNAIHHYLTKYYTGVAGFSSLFSAEVAAVLLQYQNNLGISGHIGEIGVFKGRSFIGLALCTRPPELCLGIDNFSWPANVHQIFYENCRKFGVSLERLKTIAGNSQDLSAADISAQLNGGLMRYLHIDGGHESWVLKHDLEMTIDLMMPAGIICLDDMLHPMYPELPGIVSAFLQAHPEWCTFCIVDRADVIAASKYLLCRMDFVEGYQTVLRQSFSQYAFAHHAEFASSRGLILTKDTALQQYYDILTHS